jgi:hypothetical protein
MTELVLLSRYLPGRTEENYEKLLSGYMVSQVGHEGQFETVSSMDQQSLILFSWLSSMRIVRARKWCISRFHIARQRCTGSIPAAKSLWGQQFFYSCRTAEEAGWSKMQGSSSFANFWLSVSRFFSSVHSVHHQPDADSVSLPLVFWWTVATIQLSFRMCHRTAHPQCHIALSSLNTKMFTQSCHVRLPPVCSEFKANHFKDSIRHWQLSLFSKRCLRNAWQFHFSYRLVPTVMQYWCNILSWNKSATDNSNNDEHYLT